MAIILMYASGNIDKYKGHKEPSFTIDNMPEGKIH